MVLLGLRNVLAVSSPLGFAGQRVVVRYEHLFNELVHLRFHLSDASPVGKVRQQANVPTSVGHLCFPIQLPPQTFGSGRNGCSANSYLFLLVVIISFGIIDTLPEASSRQSSFPPLL